MELKKRLKLIKKYGRNGLSYSTLQDDVRTFTFKNFPGYIGYSQVFGRIFALSEAIVPDNNLSEAYDQFIHWGQRSSKGIVFCQVGEDAAKILSSKGLYLNGFGVENVIHPLDFKISWNTRRDLKRWMSRLSKIGCHVVESNEIDIPRRIIEDFTFQFVKSKKGGKELKFLARPYVFENEPEVRKFYGFDPQGKLCGIVSFDPIYKREKLIGRMANHLRQIPGAPNGMIDYIVLQAMEKFKNEGTKIISIGVSPLYQRDDTKFRASRVSSFLFNLSYRHTNFIYPFKKLAFHKDRYKASKKQVYIASSNKNTLFDALAFIKVNNVL